MVQSSSCTVNVLEHHEFAQFNWERCTCGGNIFQRLDEDGRYFMAILDCRKAYVLHNFLWDQNIDQQRYQSFISEIQPTGFDGYILSGLYLSLNVRVMSHDDVFRLVLPLKSCPFIEGLYFAPTDEGGSFITVHGDKAVSIALIPTG
jgi:hypothetical protein